MIFNTHSHINDKLEQLDELVNQCLEANVTHNTIKQKNIFLFKNTPHIVKNSLVE